MNLINSFKNNESGAVTVDWVVLTAAIVGIGISVVALISNGVESASEEIDGGLQVASAFTFSFGGSDAMTFEDYLTAANGGVPLADGDENLDVLLAAYEAASADSPDGYSLTEYVDPNSGYPVYGSLDGSTVSVGGEVIDTQTYLTENPDLNYAISF